MLRPSRQRALRPSAPSPRQAGFTLLELMVVVTIIGVVAALAAPSIGTALANRRTNELALDVVRLVRNGRSAAAGHGVAHMLRVQDDGNFSLWRGTSDRCNSNEWATITADECLPTMPRCDMAVFPVVGDSTYAATISGGARALCFEPSGRMLWSTTAGVAADFSSVAPATGGFQVTVSRSSGGATAGVPKLVVIPFGGDARILR